MDSTWYVLYAVLVFGQSPITWVNITFSLDYSLRAIQTDGIVSQKMIGLKNIQLGWK